MKLFLTCSKDGYISLWDRAGAKSMDGEVAVELKLTAKQETEIRQAIAKSTSVLGIRPGPYAGGKG